LQVYGDKLPDLLDKERAQLSGRKLALGQALRLHAGKLHCDYMIWVGSRPPHGDDEQAPAPEPAFLEKVAQSALELADKHHTVRVAFGVLGAGPKAGDAAERLAALVRGANAFRTACRSSGRTPSIEEVLVCSASSSDIARARRATEKLAKQEAAPIAVPVKREVSSASRSRSAGSGGARSVAASAGGSRGKKRLDPRAIEGARASAMSYDRAHNYTPNEWLIHPKFGVGEVQTILRAEGMIMVLFEDGEERRLLHGRS
jgi:hypothetical protein